MVLHYYNMYLFVGNSSVAGKHKNTLFWRENKEKKKYLRDWLSSLGSHSCHLRCDFSLDFSMFLYFFELIPWWRSFLVRNQQFSLPLQLLPIVRKQIICCEYDRLRFTSTRITVIRMYGCYFFIIAMNTK